MSDTRNEFVCQYGFLPNSLSGWLNGTEPDQLERPWTKEGLSAAVQVEVLLGRNSLFEPR